MPCYGKKDFTSERMDLLAFDTRKGRKAFVQILDSSSF
ncbi:hypothetical protein WCP94_000422 (plasmid) [Bilophila wadsworthia]